MSQANVFLKSKKQKLYYEKNAYDAIKIERNKQNAFEIDYKLSHQYQWG